MRLCSAVKRGEASTVTMVQLGSTWPSASEAGTGGYSATHKGHTLTVPSPLQKAGLMDAVQACCALTVTSPHAKQATGCGCLV